MFAFRNTVDDFYVRYLETEHILVDVFALPMASQTTARPAGVIKIGCAKLPLISIIEGDKTILAQEIMNGETRVGKLFFKMDMRKSLAQDIKLHQQ